MKVRFGFLLFFNLNCAFLQMLATCIGQQFRWKKAFQLWQSFLTAAIRVMATGLAIMDIPVGRERCRIRCELCVTRRKMDRSFALVEIRKFFLFHLELQLNQDFFRISEPPTAPKTISVVVVHGKIFYQSLL